MCRRVDGWSESAQRNIEVIWLWAFATAGSMIADRNVRAMSVIAMNSKTHG